MARRRIGKSHVNHERWLVSYADFITLLFAFFVVMYAASQVDKMKMVRVAASIEGAFQQMGVFREADPAVTSPANLDKKGSVSTPAPEFGAPGPNADSNNRHFRQGNTLETDPLKQELEKTLEDEISKKSIAVRTGPDGLVISLSEVGFFDSGSAQVRPSAETSFHRISQFLAAQRCAVRVEGHTDNVPIRTSEFSSNWNLSAARAVEVVKALVDRYNFDPSLLSAAGYGEYHPIASNDTAVGRQQNRRVDLVVLSHQRDVTPPTSSEPSVASATIKGEIPHGVEGRR